MCFRHVVHHNVFHSGLTSSPSNHFCHAFGVAIHRAIAYNESVFGFVFAHTVVHSHHFFEVFVPHWSVSRAQIFKLFVGQFLQCVLHRCAILAHDVRVIAHHFEPEGFAIDFGIKQSAVKCAEAAKGIASKEHVVREVERHHCFGPVHHWGEIEPQRVLTQREFVAMFHLVFASRKTIKAFKQVERLFISHHFKVGIILTKQCERAAMVGFHVVGYHIINGSVAKNFA